MKKILFVEDDPMISEIYQKKLSQSGFDVTVAFSGEDALRKINDNNYDVVLLDLVLPGLGGVDLLRKLKQDERLGVEMQVVVFSNLNDPERQEEAYRYGAAGFILKSQFNPSEFVVEFQRLLEQFFEQRKSRLQASGTDGAEAVHQLSSEVSVSDGQKKRIVFIEDEDVFIGLFKRKLEDSGYEVVVARSGLQGLEEIYTNKVDLILTDIVMPKMRGDEMVRRIKNNPNTSSIPIIALSASVTEDEIQLVRAQGVTEFFVKTEITPGDLVRRIREIFGEPSQSLGETPM